MHAPAARPLVAARAPRFEVAARWTVPALLMLAAFAIRGWQFGTPLIHVDEDFYLFVGDRMLRGALPYIDIWDRKPVGLFLLYAGIRLLGGDGIVQYQVVATLFAGATAGVIARIAARYTPPAAAFVAGLAYLLLLGLSVGMGGQSPVFYNLFVALAALLVIDAFADGDDPATIRRRGLGAMALCGVAMQIKYNAVFEGVFFGCALIVASRRAGRCMSGIACDAALWIAVAIAPTAMAFGYYAAHGDAAAFVFANFISIGERGTGHDPLALGRLGRTALIYALPLSLVALSGWLRPIAASRRASIAYSVVLSWLAAALGGYLLFGTYFDHYALPLAGPVMAAAAPAFAVERRRLGTCAAALLIALGTWRYAHAARMVLRVHGGAPALAAELAAIRPALGQGCLWVYRGDALLYYRTRSCLYSRYAFPGHLWQASEAPAIGIDPLGEVRRILALRPPVIVDELVRRSSDINPAAEALVDTALARDYRLTLALGRSANATRIYVRRDIVAVHGGA